MTAQSPLVFYHSPNTRSSATLTLIEELGAPYERHAHDDALSAEMAKA